MAISFNNVITKEYSGRVGDIVFRNYGGKSVMSKRPDCSKVIKTARQIEFMNRFAKAVKYGQYVIKNQELSNYYRKKRPDLSPYHAAISDYMTRPVIESVDMRNYKGHPGDVVTVSAWDKWNIDKSYEKHGIAPNETEEVFLDEEVKIKKDIKLLHSKISSQ